jgi:AraC family transcriptional activator of pobA
MKSIVSDIQIYDIGEVNADLGQVTHKNEKFHIYDIDNLVYTDKMFRPRKSDHFNVTLVTQGEMQVKFNLIDYTIKKNDLFVISPGIIHQIVSKQDFLAMTVGFATEYLIEAGIHKKKFDLVTYAATLHSPKISLSELEANRLHTLMGLLNEKDWPEAEHPFREEILMHGFNIFLLELAVLCKKYREYEPTKLTQKENILTRFTTLLAKDFKVQRSVQYYADRLFITPKHLTKTLKELTNKTAGEFIDEMVITEAKVLLDDMSMSVARVSQELNFSNQFFFSKFFKRQTGINPSAYKSTT